MKIEAGQDYMTRAGKTRRVVHFRGERVHYCWLCDDAGVVDAEGLVNSHKEPHDNDLVKAVTHGAE